MATEIKPETIKEIADWLDMGMVCFYHKTTGEVESYPDEFSNPGFDDEMWEDVMNKVKKNHKDYLRLEPMRSFEAYKVMEGFIDNISDIPTHNKFIDAISRKKPFRQFDDMLSYYPDLREQWFVYKLENYIEFVKEHIGDE